ncbi:MAG: hypothetical protein CM1200mP34_2510 [Verrucomicrobiales bacterium]|nr:MAG: hypothetical protein CM1200mP34_2510 [Verrucomicrobiales bacterium]
MAGARTDADRQRLRRAAARVWPGAALHATHDLETALAADTRRTAAHRVLVLSGTGSCCYGQSPDGTTTKLGGWGHLLGDKGSGFEIGLRALKACVFYLDRDGTWSALGQRLCAGCNSTPQRRSSTGLPKPKRPRSLDWPVRCSPPGPSATRLPATSSPGAADTLARDACACARKLAGKTAPSAFCSPAGCCSINPGSRPRWAQRGSAPGGPAHRSFPLKNESGTGALQLARRLAKRPATKPGAPRPGAQTPGHPRARPCTT